MDREALNKFPGPATGPHHRLTIWREDDTPRPLVVFFGAKDLQESQFNFPSLSQDIPAHRLLLNNGGNHWYQNGIPGFAKDADAVTDLLARWAKVLRATEILCVGTSMGAYGALIHGARLGARVLAFAADHEIGFPGSQSARHFKSPGTMPFPALAPLIAKAAPGFAATLFAGEREAADLQALWHLCQLPGVTGKTVVGADHYAPSRLSRRGQLGRLLHRFVAGEAPQDMRLLGRALQHGDYITEAHAAVIALQTDNTAAALTHAEKAYQLWPDGEAGLLIRGRALLADKQFGPAAEMFLRALVTAPDDLTTMALLAQCQRELGHMDSAIALHEQILLQEPDRHASLYSLGLIYQKLGALEKSVENLRQALRLAPNQPQYQKRLDAVCDVLKRRG